MKARQAGFTLVEIAIVLVIIGLLLGGILKGQEMITQAKVKNSITDFSGVSTAYFGYQDRYRAIPGDDSGAAARWPTPTPAAVSGNGDRILSGTYVPGADTEETALWWDHLRRSGFLTGSGVANPINSFNGAMGVQTGQGPAAVEGPPVGTAAITAVLGSFTNLIMCSTNLPDKVAIALDAQMDDGNPATGAVRGQLQDPANPAIKAAAVAAYVETGTNAYTLCRQF